MNDLRLVPNGNPRPAYILWLDVDEDAISDLCDDLEKADHFVVNRFMWKPADEVPLREHLGMLAVSEVIVLPNTWWTSVVGHQLVQIAGWLGCEFIDYEGSPIETVSLRSNRA